MADLSLRYLKVIQYHKAIFKKGCVSLWCIKPMRKDDLQHLHARSSTKKLLVVFLPATLKAVFTVQLLRFHKVLQSCGDR